MLSGDPRPLLLGCIADDLTGATDLCVNLVREGLTVLQFNGVPPAALKVWGVSGDYAGHGFAQGVSDDAKSFASSLTAPFCGVTPGFDAVRIAVRARPTGRKKRFHVGSR